MTSDRALPRSSGPRIIVALDFPSVNEALAMATRLDPARLRVKVGMELFTAAGPAILDGLRRLGFEVFLDLKFHDIPNTVAGACRAAAAQGVWMLNVHASGGRRMMEAAREAAGDADGRPLVIAVTVPTSMDRGDLVETGVAAELSDQVRSLARLSQACGLDGIVCSALDLRHLRGSVDADFLRVTPGIRIEDDDDDQRRVTTPGDAIRAGADFLVIGRSITRAPNPSAVLDLIERDVAACGA
ncbi:MAG: orotidine-5'-phosphate decarboxylase [Gammaproteobacteria bacterium]|nr:orotidine-5'-phosphate decarboxylase [Gammaproteobacteria bacterium]